jgi:carbonic anhydrase
MALIEPAAKKIGPRGDTPFDEYITKLELASVLTTIDNLMTFPCVKILVERGKLALHGAYFGVASGRLSVHDKATGEFKQVASEEYGRMFSQPRF